MRLDDRIKELYKSIKSECAIITCSDSKHFPFLLNAIYSIRQNFYDHPKIIVYDIGLSFLDLVEIDSIDYIEIRQMPKFVEHWRLNWSWKLFALTNQVSSYNLYLDLPNFVINRSLAPLFCIIKKNGYLLVDNEQLLYEITPSDYWSLFKIDQKLFRHLPTFGAGIVGFHSRGSQFTAITDAMEKMLAGFNLGRSENEKNQNYRPNIQRDCLCFRADQTLLNLSFRKMYGHELKIYKSKLICGIGNKKDHLNQYLWYSRRSHESLEHLFIDILKSKNIYVFFNRLRWWAFFNTRFFLKRAYYIFRDIFVFFIRK